MSRRYGMTTTGRDGNYGSNGSNGSNGYGGLGGEYGGGGGGGPPRRSDDDYDPYGESYGRYDEGSPVLPPTTLRTRSPPPAARRTRSPQPPRARSPQPPPRNGGYGQRQEMRQEARQQAPPPRQQRMGETSAERQINQVLDHIKQEWPAMCETECIPVQLALQLLDTSSVGRAHEYRNFQKTHRYLQDSLKNIVNEHHQGFNSSIGTFHKIQGSIQSSQKRVRALKESLVASRTSLCQSDPELQKLSKTSQAYDHLIQLFDELEELRQVPDQLEARISEKRFLTAVDVLQNALRKLRRPELDDIGALSDLRSYLVNQEAALTDILVEELHEHLYLKSPYCQDRWQNLAKNQGATHDSTTIAPFHQLLDGIDFEQAVTEDPARNPEADTFYFIGLLVEALNKLGRLQGAVDTLKQRLPVELFTIVNETTNEVDQRHPSAMRGGTTNTNGLHVYGNRETKLRADVIYDLLWTLYGKFEAIAEGQRVFHESVKALIRREGAGDNSALLGSFKELWNLYQNEIRSLLHNYVTTDADIYEFNTAASDVGAALSGKKDTKKDLFKFSDADAKAVELTTELEALENIIQSAVPGLTNRSRNQGSDKKASMLGVRPYADGGAKGDSGSSYYNRQATEPSKSLVEPSVFNMSLLLPATLVFLQRLKNIVPPGSDLATSTLTSFLDNFLVNVFQPQLDETLSKLSESIFGEIDSFLQDQEWSVVAKRPILKGTTAFFTVVTAFCKMLGTIPHDQALSSLIVTQMMRYYERCLSWYKSLVTKAQDHPNGQQTMRASARIAMEQGALNEAAKKLWDEPSDPEALETEIQLLTEQAGERPLEMSDVIQDRDTISSLCLLYTSMKWLSIKISGLRHITTQETDSSRPNLPRQSTRRWTLMNDPNKAGDDQGPVYLPMTQETVSTFDGIISSYEDLAQAALLTLRMEARCRLLYSLGVVLSPETAPYVLDQEVREPDPEILALNSELVSLDETTVRFLREREIGFIRTGLGLLVNRYLVGNAPTASPMNSKGCGRMRLNVLVLQQNLRNIEEGADLSRASEYFSLFDKGPDAIVEKAKEVSAAQQEEGVGGDGEGVRGVGKGKGGVELFTFDELKNLMELCYSEQLNDPERGVTAAAKREMADKMLNLSEFLWQS
ncbi:related to secretion protein rsec8 [Cephalotrichum gorgonifer]|uniref:Exocyst complex component Sec8 n=1 Tax=Cephalotrichum gorgonifer TaxID=2041049 RepID=A0AAE8MWH5_9PEZI|nr:related to secretion protein rsec8 [Cephalotrichum gorgonifer]